MASDRQQFRAALRKWEQLGLNGVVSVPVDVGTTAIVTSSFTDAEPGTRAAVAERQAFETEATELARRVTESGGRPVLAIDASRPEINSLIADHTVASVYVVGNGSLSTLVLGVRDYYDWTDAAAASTHRKQGVFVQRQCGGLTRALNVPLGLFVLDVPVKVLAALGEEFNPRSLDDPVNDRIASVMHGRDMRYEALRDWPTALVRTCLRRRWAQGQETR